MIEEHEWIVGLIYSISKKLTFIRSLMTISLVKKKKKKRQIWLFLLLLFLFFSPSSSCPKIPTLRTVSTQKYGNSVAAHEWGQNRTPPQLSGGVERKTGRQSDSQCVGTRGRVGVNLWDDFQHRSLFCLYSDEKMAGLIQTEWQRGRMETASQERRPCCSYAGKRIRMQPKATDVWRC